MNKYLSLILCIMGIYTNIYSSGTESKDSKSKPSLIISKDAEESQGSALLNRKRTHTAMVAAATSCPTALSMLLTERTARRASIFGGGVAGPKAPALPPVDVKKHTEGSGERRVRSRHALAAGANDGDGTMSPAALPEASLSFAHRAAMAAAAASLETLSLTAGGVGFASAGAGAFATLPVTVAKSVAVQPAPPSAMAAVDKISGDALDELCGKVAQGKRF